MSIVNSYMYLKLIQCIWTNSLSSRVRGAQKRQAALLCCRETGQERIPICSCDLCLSNHCPDVESAVTRTESFKILF